MSEFPNGNHDRQGFQIFFEHWILEQNKHLQDLISASKLHKRSNTNTTLAAESTQTGETLVPDNPHLRPLINGVILHYEKYHQAKARYAKQDAVVMLTPPWTSALENAFMWIGGWRPSMAFQLLYSNFIQGLSIGDLGDLSPRQLVQIDNLQERTIREERKITEKMAKHQETVADQSMVQLSHLVTEFMRNEVEEGRSTGGGGLEERVGSVLELKKKGLERILLKADDLRLRTLKAILDVFTPIQAVHFLIAAAELQLRFHDWGKKDANQHVTGGGN
ncbi:hypothetical protein CIPAW_03G116100 [Carya illinoinensis]|uniref:DOG1 domain-containing protein n=1 Tax=Carya illinoinensis TaxID=32201 RepID=A0A8T1R1J9_CARIL|nr:hypothetical protein CIPAW_03G116100 [Carya illinoinensis]